MAGTPRTAKSHEISPLTPLEERVFQDADAGGRAYNVFDDDSILKMCDDEVDRGANGDAHSPTHGWRIDNVIDKYGNRIASRSKRLARIVAHRKSTTGAPAPSERMRMQPSPQLPVAAANARRSLHHRSSANGSSSTAGTASATSSPMPGRAELADAQGVPLSRVQDNRMGGLISKARLRMQSRSLRGSRARRKLGSSDSRNLAASEPNTQGPGGARAARAGDSGSFDYADYSAGGSTSTILHRRGPSDSAHSAASAAGQRGWWAALLQRNHERAHSANRLPASPARGTHAANSDRTADMQPPRHTHGNSSSTNWDAAANTPKEPERAGAEPTPGPAHKVWSKLTGFIMPGGHNRFGMRDERAYTESIGFLLAFALASVAFIMWGTLVPKALCSTDQTFTLDNVSQRKFVAANGIVSDFTLSHTAFGHTMRGYSGYDISAIFPMIGQFAPDTFEALDKSTASMLSKCMTSQAAVDSFLESWVANSTLYTGEFATFPDLCPFPQAPQTSGAACMVESFPQFLSSKVGMLKLNASEIATRHASPTTSWVVIDDLVYDVSQYLTYATDPIVTNGTVDSNRQLREDSMFLPRALTQLFIDKAGQDISEDFDNLDIDGVMYKQCLSSLFLRGTTVTTKSPFACANTNIVAWVTFGLYFLVLFFRLAIAEIYARVRARKAVLSAAGSGEPGKHTSENSVYAQHPGATDDAQTAGSADQRSLEAGMGGGAGALAKCLVVVPCFQESIETLTRTLQSIARSAHADSHKMLWIINDGDADVLSSIVRILAHSGHISDPKFYGAYSVDSNSSSYGSARVYAGFYECGRHRIPYVVTAKETYQGRVDSLMMVLNFFRSLASSSRHQQPSDAFGASGSAVPQTIFLEEEVELRMALLGHAPAAIDYCLLLDGSVQLDPLAITQFVARMERNAGIVALSGTLYPVGRPTSLVQILQTFEFYLRHFVSPICESLSNVTCPLNQLFTMYRVRLGSGERCLGDDELVASMDALMKSSVRYRHRTWPANDCLLVPRMVRRFPRHRWSFEPNGRAEIELNPHVLATFDPYERQWFRTRLVTLFDILRGRMLKRTLPIMLGHLLFPFIVPAASCMLYLEIVISMFGDSPAIVVSELTAAFLAVTFVLLLVCRKWQLALYFLVYCAIGVPFYHVWIPVTSFFSMNRIWYSPEQIAAQLATAEAQVQPPENFEAIKNSYLRRFHPGRHHHRHSLSSQSSNNGSIREQPAARFAGDASSDSEPEIIEHPSDSPRRQYKPADGFGAGLGLNIPTSATSPTALKQSGKPLNPAQIVVSSSLMSDARAILRQLLHDHQHQHQQRIEPESADFYSLCEQVLRVLIPKYPSSTVPELAMAVSRAADEMLGASPAVLSPITASPRIDGSVKGKEASGFSSEPPLSTAHSPFAFGMPSTHKFARQGSGYMGHGRPVSVIMEESDSEQQ
ncbi:hypothetical protein H4S02_004620 [Coemansia sp. RSA 2611]|nr:hypothetical protein H4S02_004620 [Coemansia sp. RSA 2611]